MESVEDDGIGNKKRKSTTDGKAIREAKQRKWEAKQRRKDEQAAIERDRTIYFDKHSEFASLVTEKDVQNISDDTAAISDQIKDDLAPYFNIQDTQREHNDDTTGSSSSSSREQRLFIAEGTETIRILIQQYTHKKDKRFSDLGLQRIQLKSIFVKPSVFFEDPVKLISDVNDAIEQNSSTGFRVLVGESDTVLSMVAGFPISRGALACGIVPDDRDEEWLDGFIQNKSFPLRLLALDGICDTANLGSMIRTASAFGIHAIILSDDSCDAWYRRSIRVSMGHFCFVPTVRVKNLAAFLAKWGSFNSAKKLTSYAAVVQSEDLRLDRVPRGDVPSNWCCVMGNEGNGIKEEVLKGCTHRIRIDMVDGVDSLSVPIATGILLHGLREREGTRESS